MLFFFFKQKTAYEMRISDWSSDVCSSDLLIVGDARMFAHDGALHDALAVDHAAEPARPGGVDQCVGHRAAIERRDIAAEQDAVIGDDDADRRVELTETAQHRSEEHTSELQSIMRSSNDAFCLKQKI